MCCGSLFFCFCELFFDKECNIITVCTQKDKNCCKNNMDFGELVV